LAEAELCKQAAPGGVQQTNNLKASVLLRSAVAAAYRTQNFVGGLDDKCERAYQPLWERLQQQC
jgi:hypothetical protein